MTKRYSTTRTINFADCDPDQIVFYPRFFEMFDRNTEGMFRSRGVHWEELFPRRDADREKPPADGDFSGMPLLDVNASFKVRVSMGQTIEIHTWIDEFRGKTFLIRHEVFNGDVLCCEGRELRAYVVRDSSAKTGVRAVPMPADLQARLAG